MPPVGIPADRQRSHRCIGSRTDLARWLHPMCHPTATSFQEGTSRRSPLPLLPGSAGRCSRELHPEWAVQGRLDHPGQRSRELGRVARGGNGGGQEGTGLTLQVDQTRGRSQSVGLSNSVDQSMGAGQCNSQPTEHAAMRKPRSSPHARVQLAMLPVSTSRRRGPLSMRRIWIGLSDARQLRQQRAGTHSQDQLCRFLAVMRKSEGGRGLERRAQVVTVWHAGAWPDAPQPTSASA